MLLLFNFGSCCVMLPNMGFKFDTGNYIHRGYLQEVLICNILWKEEEREEGRGGDPTS